VFGHVELIAVPDRQGETATNAALTPQGSAEPLQRVEQSTGQQGIIDLIRIKEDRLFEMRLTRRRQYRQ
jgi:hypothetical protein